VFFAPPPIFFGGQAPKFLDWRYKVEHASEHDAKFCRDRLRDLGDYALKKRNVVKHKAFQELPFWAEIQKASCSKPF